jgi:hypothetical protein
MRSGLPTPLALFEGQAIVAHHPILSSHPRLAVAFDTDLKHGVASRVKLFETLSANKIPAMVFHMVWSRPPRQVA